MLLVSIILISAGLGRAVYVEWQKEKRKTVIEK
jgi:hypothetical protein